MSYYKTRVFSELDTRIKDNATITPIGEVIIKDSVTGKVLFKGRNKVIVPGSLWTAQNHFPRMAPALTLPNYNTVLNLDHTLSADEKPANQLREVWLFAVGTDGARLESTQINVVDKSKWIPKDYLVPFRYVPETQDNVDRDLYFGRKTIPNSGLGADNVAYYFKTFSTEPVMYPNYKDGTPITSTMYTDINTDPEVMVEIRFKVTPEDCREWFKAMSAGGLADARINTISLLHAWYDTWTEGDGCKYYQDIQPLTKLNFTTEYLYDDSKGLDIIYHLYY